MTIREWIEKNASKYKTKEEAVNACVKYLGFQRDTVVRKIGKSGVFNKSPSGNADDGITVDQFLSQHDPLTRLREAVKKLVAGKILIEAEFRERIVGLDSSRFRSKADLQEFESYRGRSGGRIYWSHPTTIRSLKEKGVMV